MVNVAEPPTQNDTGSPDLGREIRRRRTELHLSRADLGAMVGISESYVGHIENAKRFPHVTLLRSLASALRLDYEDLAILAGLLPPREHSEMVRAPAEKAPILRRLLSYSNDRLIEAERWLRIMSTEPVPPQDEAAHKATDERAGESGPEKPEANADRPA